VHHDRQAEHTGRLQSLEHDPRVSRRLAVIGESNCTGCRQGPEIDRPMATSPFANRRNGTDSDKPIACSAALQFLECDNGIECRLSIRHAENGREPAGRGGGGPGSDRLLPFLSGFPQMNMYVNQPRRDHETGGVYDSFRAIRIESSNFCDNPIMDANVGYAVKGNRWVDYATPTQK
jgi:hypothetical protein